MSDRFNDNSSGNISSDLRSEGLGPTQGQRRSDDPTTHVPHPELRSEGRGPTQGQEQGQLNVDPTTRASHFGSRTGGDPFQDTNQYADPDFSRQDPARGRFDDQDRSSGTSGGQNYGQQGGQPGGDNTYGGDGGDPRQTGYRTGQLVGDPQERFETPQNYGTSTGTGPGARPDDYEIHGDGGFGGKPSMPERVMGTTEKIVGKATGNARMYEHGQERKAGGY